MRGYVCVCAYILYFIYLKNAKMTQLGITTYLIKYLVLDRIISILEHLDLNSVLLI